MARPKIDVSQIGWAEAISGSVSITGSLYLSALGNDSNVIIVGPNNSITSTDTLYIDEDNGRVGMNTTSPQEQFHIHGNNATLRLGNGSTSGEHSVKLELSELADGNGDMNYGFSVGYNGTSNDFEIKKYQNSTSGTNALTINRSSNLATFSNDVVISGSVYVSQYIYHNGDNNTLINFADDKIVFKAGGKAMITMEEKNSAPHEVTINDGGNNIDFVVKGNGSNAGNPGMKFDASNNRVGINGVGTPATELHINGALTLGEKSSDPSDPSEGQSVLWMSDGTGTGDDGDIMIKITAGGVTKTATLVDFSAS